MDLKKSKNDFSNLKLVTTKIFVSAISIVLLFDMAYSRSLADFVIKSIIFSFVVFLIILLN